MKPFVDRGTTRGLTGCKTIILFLAILTAAGCGGAGTQNSKGGPPGRETGRGGLTGSAVSVETDRLQRVSIQRNVDITGSLESTDQANVSSEVAGVVQQVLIQLGQEVRVGQVIVKLDPRELDLALQRARSQLRQTEAQLGIEGDEEKELPPDEQISSVRLAIANRDDALAQLRRAQRLRDKNLLPQADLDAAETRVKVTEANYQAAIENVRSLKATLQDRRHALELAEKKLNDTNIRASISGQINARMVQEGEYIRENTPVVAIVKMNPLKVRASIQERYAGLVRSDMPVEFEVEAYPGTKFQGKVAYISPSVDPATRTFPVEILVDNAQRLLRPGFFVKGVIFTRRDENVLAVPEKAIFTLAGVSSVYVIEQGKARQQSVTLGTRVDGYVELLGGLKGDEILAASNLSLLATGVSVQIEEPPSLRDQTLENGSGIDNQGGRP